MKTKVITEQELISMPNDEFRMTSTLLKLGCFRMLGMNWKNYIRWWQDPLTQAYHFEWE